VILINQKREIKTSEQILSSLKMKPFQEFARKLVWGEIREEKRVPIPSDTKKAVYERAKRRCECCGRPLKMNQGEFHHRREPTVKSRPLTIQFLCGTCHKNYGHEYYTIPKRDIHPGPKKETRIKRKRVRKHPSSPYWKEKLRTRKSKKVTKTRKIK